MPNCHRIPEVSGADRHMRLERSLAQICLSVSSYNSLRENRTWRTTQSSDTLTQERRSHETSKEYKGKTQNKADSFTTCTAQKQSQATKCPLCEKTHALAKCHEFKNKKLEQRRGFMKSKGLCFGCLKSGHLSISHQSRFTCGECGKPHPTLLHSS